VVTLDRRHQLSLTVTLRAHLAQIALFAICIRAGKRRPRLRHSGVAILDQANRQSAVRRAFTHQYLPLKYSMGY
jgi:hypothetical protein